MTATKTKINGLTLEQVVATLSVYPLPQTAVIPVLMRMTSDLNTDTNDLARILSADPALAGRVVQLSNSPFYGCVQQVTNLTDAIRVLGFYTIRSLAIAVSASGLFQKEGRSELEEELWRHSLAVATMARLVARRIGSPQIEEEVFLTALLHDISKLVLIQGFADEYLPVVREGAEGDEGHLIVESARLGFTHADLSAIILEQWGFPERIVGVIHRYNVPDLMYLIRKKHRIEQCELTLPHIVCFAHELANSLGYGFQEAPEVDMMSLSSTEHLKLTAIDVQEISEEFVFNYCDEQGFYSQLSLHQD